MTVECKDAIIIVADKKDGYCGYGDAYLDAFIIALQEIQRHDARIRIDE